MDHESFTKAISLFLVQCACTHIASIEALHAVQFQRKTTDGCVLIHLARQLAGHVSVIFTNVLHAYVQL